MTTLETAPLFPGLLHPLYDDLERGVGGRAKRVIVGLNWTLVEGPHGAGLAHTPTRGTNGCRSLPDPPRHLQLYLAIAIARY